MKEPRQITTLQSSIIVINSTIGISVLALPRIASENVGSGALMATGLGIMFSILGVIVIASLSRRFTKENLISYSQKIVGKPIGKLVGFILMLYFAALSSIVLREFGEVMNTTLLQDTPITVTTIALLIVVAVATRNNMTTISFMHTYYLPFIVLPIITMVIFSIQDMDIRNIKPILGNGTMLVDLLGGGLSIVSLPFIQIGLFIILIITPHMVQPKTIIKGGVWGILISGVVIFLATFATLAVFGSEEVKKSLWPMLVLTRMTELPVAILERLDIVFLVVWIISAFTTLLSGYLIFIELGSQLFRLRSHRVLSYLGLVIVYGLAFYPDNILHLYQVTDILGKWGLTLTIFYPLVLLTVAKLRRMEADQ